MKRVLIGVVLGLALSILGFCLWKAYDNKDNGIVDDNKNIEFVYDKEVVTNGNVPSIGASGAIFGLFGAMLYFGYNYRVYLGNTIIRQMLPIIIINLLIGFASTGIDNFAHIGGLVGGILSSMVVGLKYRENVNLRINGIVISIMVLGFLIYVNFFLT